MSEGPSGRPSEWEGMALERQQMGGSTTSVISIVHFLNWGWDSKFLPRRKPRPSPQGGLNQGWPGFQVLPRL